MKTALVTGDRGFVGRHFARALRDEGWDVTGCDLADGKDAREFFRLGGTAPGNQSFDLVVHCAAVVGGRATIDGPPLALASNLELDSGLFQWALKNRPGRILYFSSSAVYPVEAQRPGMRTWLRESEVDFGSWSIGVPDQLYGWAKLTGEILARRARAEGLAVSVVRPFSGYGADQDESYPFPAFAERALNREDPFEIWGDGLQTRDFIHIDDIVGACVVMYEEGIDGPVNLGTGQATDMTELAVMVCAQAHYSPEFAYRKDAPQGVACRVAEVSRMRRFYQPRVSLEQGIAQALKWRRRGR